MNQNFLQFVFLNRFSHGFNIEHTEMPYSLACLHTGFTCFQYAHLDFRFSWFFLFSKISLKYLWKTFMKIIVKLLFWGFDYWYFFFLIWRHFWVFHVKSMREMIMENEFQNVLVPCFIHYSILTILNSDLWVIKNKIKIMINWVSNSTKFIGKSSGNDYISFWLK
jgi:hypothetical protein